MLITALALAAVADAACACICVSRLGHQVLGEHRPVSTVSTSNNDNQAWRLAATTRLPTRQL
jgi:acyl-coenzyme A thioesterase PaaI-like protein